MKNNWTIGFLVILVCILTVGTAVLTAQINKVEKDIKKQNTQDTNPTSNTTNIYWSISKVEPNSSNSQNKDITVTSNSGIIRKYQDVMSFGLSVDGELLAIRTVKGIEVINLDGNKATLADLPSSNFFTNYGETISWSYKSEYFIIGVVLNGNKNTTAVWIFNSQAKFVNQVNTLIPTLNKDTFTIYNPLFAKNSNTILVRTYEATDTEDTKTDGSKYLSTEAPLYLANYKVDGGLQQKLLIRDFNSETTQIFYRWANSKQDIIEYVLLKEDQTFDSAQSHLLTQIRL